MLYFVTKWKGTVSAVLTLHKLQRPHPSSKIKRKTIKTKKKTQHHSTLPLYTRRASTELWPQHSLRPDRRQHLVLSTAPTCACPAPPPPRTTAVSAPELRHTTHTHPHHQTYKPTQTAARRVQPAESEPKQDELSPSSPSRLSRSPISLLSFVLPTHYTASIDEARR